MKFPKLKNKFILAPMADVSILPFRLLCRKYGASLAFTEQINAMAMVQKNEKTIAMAKTCEEDKPLSLQLSGNSAKHLVDASNIVSGYDFLDINMGCPSRKIVNMGYGSALLKEKEKLHEMMSYVVENKDVPVTVKMRSGFKKNEAPEIAKTLEKAGVSAITIHARTQEQGYSGSADWNTIKTVKESVNIPVIGNGDITTPKRAIEMLEITGCDYVMIGREAIKNPSIFKQCIEFEKGKEFIPDKIKIFETYLELCKKYDYELSNIRMIAMNLIRGEESGAKARDRISRTKTEKDLVHEFTSFLESRQV